MKRIKVKLKERSYDIIVAKGAIKRLPNVLREIGKSAPVVIITDRTVEEKCKKLIAPAVKKLPGKVIKIVLPPGEAAKSLKVFRRTSEKIAQETKTHRPVIVAIGGGVVGDLAGFIAATYRRGVPLVQVPTTLLSQVDSSIGGKVGIDLPQAKNLIGAFWQPKAVLIDTDFLKTLPLRQIRNGLAEVIKYGIIKKKELFTFLEKNLGAVMALKPKVLEKIVSDCASIKAAIVEKDELDSKDIRIALNFGHTLGHAIETASGYSNKYNHGEAISLGMIMAGEIALKRKIFKEEELYRIEALFYAAGLPVKLKKISLEKVLKAHLYDKKFTKGANRFVLPDAIGSVCITEDVPIGQIKSVLKKYSS